MKHFDQMYHSGNYSGALAQGEIILEERGTSRSIWINIDPDARRTDCRFLKQMQHCAHYQKQHFPSKRIDQLLVRIQTALKENCGSPNFDSIPNKPVTKTQKPLAQPRARSNANVTSKRQSSNGNPSKPTKNHQKNKKNSSPAPSRKPIPAADTFPLKKQETFWDHM